MSSSIFTCIKCTSPFDLQEKTPRILPCNNSICMSCLNECARSICGFRVACTCNEKFHSAKTLQEFYPCRVAINYLTDMQNELIVPPSSSVDMLKKQLDMSKYGLNLAKFEVSRHYDALEMDIEIRAETLIALIHDKRDQLLNSITTYREQTDIDFDLRNELHALRYKDLENSYNNAKKVTSQLPDVMIVTELNRRVLCDFNKVQRSIEDIQYNILYY